MLTCTSAKLWEQVWRATARLQGRRERKREQRWSKLNALAAHTATYFLNYGESDDRVTRQAMSDRQQDVRWLQVHTRLAWQLIHSMDPLVAHGLTVKLSPCPCSHSSPAGQIAACLCGLSKCNLLLGQACPRMIQHLSSVMWISRPRCCFPESPIAQEMLVKGALCSWISCSVQLLPLDITCNVHKFSVSCICFFCCCCSECFFLYVHHRVSVFCVSGATSCRPSLL